ncbi:MAG: TRASH domain-containing protein [Clostridiales Family XIII bacterium]|jgi:predicted nucleic acid-binding Zn ribbon protein|nr:TRASH domain-containing protein [Clostridiales Family XIII bacterium]
MEKCVYCGKELPEKPVDIQVKNTTFQVCSDTCEAASQEYLRKDKKFKTVLYGIVLLTAIAVLISALSGGSNMLVAHIFQIAVGIAFFIFPYPISYFTTFRSCSISTVIKICKVIGVLLALSGILFIIL